MAKKVILTPLALQDFDKVIDYLTENWGLDVVNDFVDRFEEVVVLLSKNANIYAFFDLKKDYKNVF